MKKKTLISEVRKMQKIAGILKEEDFGLSDTPEPSLNIQDKLLKGFSAEFPANTMFVVYDVEGVRQYINYEKVFTGNKTATLKYLTDTLLIVREQMPDAFEEYFNVWASTQGYEYFENIKSLDIPYDDEHGYIVVAAEDAKEAERELNALT